MRLLIAEALIRNNKYVTTTSIIIVDDIIIGVFNLGKNPTYIIEMYFS